MESLQTRLERIMAAWGSSIAPWLDDEIQPEIIQANRDVRAVEYPYNAGIQALVKERHGLPDSLDKCISSQVYLSQKFLDDEERQRVRNTMSADGWELMTPEELNKLQPGKRILLKRGSKAEPVKCRVIESGGNIGLLPGRNRSRGYNALSFATEAQSFYRYI